MLYLLRLIYLSFLLFSGCKCRLAKDPLPTVYRSIEASKENNAFIEELKPQFPFLKIEGKEYHIKNAWLEYSHLERNYSDIKMLNLSVVITFQYEPNSYLDFHS